MCKRSSWRVYVHTTLPHLSPPCATTDVIEEFSLISEAYFETRGTVVAWITLL